MKPRTWYFWFLTLLLVAGLGAGCGSDGKDSDPDEDGFLSAGAGSGGRNGYDSPEAAGDGDMTADGDVQNDAEREIAEADIFQVEGDTVFVLNAHKGLIVIDATDPAAMEITGRLYLEGFPKEMFVEDGVATILLTNLYETNEEERSRAISKVAAVDVSDIEAPALIKDFSVQGTILDSRRVGDVVYVASTVQPWWDWCYGASENENNMKTEIASINIADPNDIFQADSIEFDGVGFAIYVTAEAMFLAQSTTDSYWDDGQQSDITYIDISDPEGDIVKRGTFKTAAMIADRFKMHKNGNIFAAISITNSWNGNTILETFDVSNPDDITLQGRVTVMENEELHATNFEGDRAYIVTYRNTDPLFVVDFSDAGKPTVLGQLVIPGWSTHLEVRGTKLLGVGIDDQSNWSTKVALFDVADPTDPTELASITLGEGYSWSEATNDWKAFKIYDDLDLILVPSSGYDRSYESTVNLLYLIDIERNAETGEITGLTKRGSVASDSPVRRGFPVGDHLASLSETAIQMIDYADRDHPAIVSELALANFVSSLQLCSGLLCNTGQNSYSAAARLQLFDPAISADTPVWKSGELERNAARLEGGMQVLSSGSKTYLFSQTYGYWEVDGNDDMQWRDTGGLRLHGFDLSDADNPVFLGSARLNDSSDDQGGYYAASNVALTENSVMAWTYEDWYGDYYYRTGFDLKFLDISDLGDLGDATAFEIQPLLWRSDLIVTGDSVWTSTCDQLNGDDLDRPLLKCYALEFDTEGTVTQAQKINIPGHLVGVSADKTRLYTMDRQFASDTADDGYYSCRYSFEILEVKNGRARRLRSIPLTTVDYCLYVDDEDEGEGSEPAEPISDGDVAADGDVAPDPDNATEINAKRRARPDADSGMVFSQASLEGDKIFLIWQRGYGSYGEYMDGDVAVSSIDGSCVYEDDGSVFVEVLNGRTGNTEKEIEIENASQVQKVDGGGWLAAGMNYSPQATTYDFTYISPAGEKKELGAPETVSSGYYWYSGAVRVDDMLYLPLGWEGIKVFGL